MLSVLADRTYRHLFLAQVLALLGTGLATIALGLLAYDLENIISPLLAAVLLVFVSYNALFLGTVIGFVGSALLVVSVMLPNPKPIAKRGIYDRTTRGTRIYLATPRLRGLLSLNFAAAAAGAMVLVNTVVLVRSDLGLGDTQVAIALGAFGGGSMLAALLLPRLLDNQTDRPVMIGGALVLVAALLALSLMAMASEMQWIPLLAGWFIIGIGYSAVLTPSGRLLKRSAHAEDRPAVYAAQFALSHACWLVTYPLAGWLITVSGPTTAFAILALLAGIGMVSGIALWPKDSSGSVQHSHDDLPTDHPHVRDGQIHSHRIVIDDYHHQWPRLVKSKINR